MEGFREKFDGFASGFGKGKMMVLSTVDSDHVSSRMMSVIQFGGLFYFQTDRLSRKYSQLKNNPRVALCIDNIQIEGTCVEMGRPTDCDMFCQLFKECFPEAYRRYSGLQNGRLFFVRPAHVERWLYIDGAPYIEQFDVAHQAYDLSPYNGV